MTTGDFDSRLITQMRGGSISFEQAWIELYPELVSVGARFATATDAEDVAQTAIYKAWTGLDGFRGRNDSQLRAWLRTIVRRECLMLHRRGAVRPESPLDQRDPVEDASTPSETARREEERVRLRDLLAELTEEQFEALSLRYLEGWKIGDIADQMGKSVDAVSGLLTRGLKQLRNRTTPSEWSRILG